MFGPDSTSYRGLPKKSTAPSSVGPTILKLRIRYKTWAKKTAQPQSHSNPPIIVEYLENHTYSTTTSKKLMIIAATQKVLFFTLSSLSISSSSSRIRLLFLLLAFLLFIFQRS